jgi:hypothetical protein
LLWIAVGVDVPAFVAGLIKAVFDAVVDASIRQMEAYADLLRRVATSVGKFVASPRHPRCARG